NTLIAPPVPAISICALRTHRPLIRFLPWSASCNPVVSRSKDDMRRTSTVMEAEDPAVAHCLAAVRTGDYYLLMAMRRPAGSANNAPQPTIIAGTMALNVGSRLGPYE